MRILAFVLGFLAWLAAPLAAQEVETEEPGGFVVNLLEDLLSSDNRYIHVVGLKGALSSRATIEQITIADDDGVWLTINNAVLDWSRLALLRRNFSVKTLSAEKIIVARPPTPVEPDPELPTPEAQPFRLPELPVAVRIGELSVGRLELAEPVVGIAADLSVDGTLSLAEGALESQLNIARLDRTSDRIELTAGYSNQSSEITLDLVAEEEQDGLLSQLLSIPDSPALRLSAKGQGPVSDFTADIALASDGQNRLSGQVNLSGVPDPDALDDSDQRDSIAFQAQLAGDVTPLMAAQYHTFFGTETRLDLSGRSDADGTVAVKNFDIESNALTLTGALDIAAGGNLDNVVLEGRITPPQGDSVVLPISGPATTIQSANIAARVDGPAKEWMLQLAIDGLGRPDLELRRAEISADGTLDQSQGLDIRGQVNAALEGLDLNDADLNRAVGENIVLTGRFDRPAKNALNLRGFRLAGTDYAAILSGEIDGLSSGFQIDGSAEVTASDLSRFSGLAGRPLGGAIKVTLTGDGAPLGGFFDISLNAKAQDLSADIDQLDPLITGETDLALDAVRDESGMRITQFQIDGTALNAQAQADLRTEDSTLTFNARLDDLARVVPQVSGPLTVKGDLKHEGTDWTGTVRATGPNDAFANLNGRYSTDGSGDVTFDAAVTQFERFVPEIRGTVTATGSAKSADGSLWQVATRLDGPSGSFADLTGMIEPDGSADLQFDAAVKRFERFVPEAPGTVTAKGSAQRNGTTWRIDTNATGPAGIAARVNGTLNETDLNADINATGQLQLAAANRFMSPNSARGLARFDLSLKGQPSLQALSGTISTNGASVALPAAATTLNDINATVQLANASAQINVTGGLRDGGQFRVSGPIELTPPLDANLSMQLNQLVLTDNVSLESVADGQLAFDGPLLGNGTLSGRIIFGETEINIAALSGAVGAAPLPSIRHIGQPAAARRTLDYAGLINKGNGGDGPVYNLNLQLDAPNRIFVRGRGLQAELGGGIRVGGTTENVVPSGQVELLRGTFDILGRRLQLDRGLITLQGRLQPVMDFSASTSTSEGTATLLISGALDSPVIEVTSDPERPSEEALAMLVFGDEFTSLSPVKIAQLASSLATLGGKGGGFMSRLRENLGLDQLDIGTDAGGSGQVGVGNYLSDTVYTEFSVNAQGETEINLNFDVTESFTVKGMADNTGDTSLGLFFERDY
ncbi:translocation/assembly module TamB domain-containing protein [Pontibaca salina]|uniref:Translocation/assembly module TamB domain-containing protein n=1 Tax=Pontibaca salina TaxID=2795731 RepID=A0A934M3T6_9RHOB|nr:translocation/assembly module TamB domain-containing protein [Pontibaca salina]MBI6630194.1 translocation/assembly module TamB domain-containing protein [Pontibaca salina]